jgi:hypothetical protein
MKRTGHELFDAQVAEMTKATDPVDNELVPVSQELLTSVSEGDDHPLFVTLNIATEGVSKNGRHYTRETIQAICDQINAEVTDGNNGHVADADRAFARPDPATLWLGARVVVKNGVARLYAKGYIMPEEVKLRSYLRKAKAIGKNVAVSIFGKAEKATYNASLKAYTLEGFTLQSVDWARSKSEGIPNDGTLILASEMVNEEDNVNRVDTIKSISAEELREHNPALVAEMETNVQAVDVSEMEMVTGLLGDKPGEAVSEMLMENRTLKLDAELAAKVRAKSARPVLRQMVVAEMEKAEDQKGINVSEMLSTVLASDEGRAIVAANVDRAPRIDPRNDAPESVAERKHTTITKRAK